MKRQHKMVVRVMFFLIFVIAVGVWIYADFKSREERAIKEANFSRTAEGKKAKIIEASLKNFPTATIIVDYGGDIAIIRSVDRNNPRIDNVFYSTKGGFCFSNSTKTVFSRIVKDYYFPPQYLSGKAIKERAYLTEMFVQNKRVPSDWKSQVR